ncbi:MAG: VWA domain-containing protein [Comamonadaceae bacterium]|nr:VWA domain-containing protein [Burkholderiales bacterium]MEB2348915.1 VWA domain-containing protein [Comamonadaceae bacterium]
MRRTLRLLGIAAGIALASQMALADSISPETFSATLDIGESVTITKTVVISKGAPTSALVDVKFVADTTGSMSGIINSAKSNATSIMGSLATYGDTQFGASEYKDRTDSYTTKVNQVLTSNTAAVQAGINQWGALGGGDTPEANLIALKQQAEATDWRDGSNRFIVQFGDAPGHEGGAYPTQAETIAALKDNNVKVLVVGTGNGVNNGMNSSCGGSDCAAGAATAIATATGGSFSTISSDGTGIAKLIEDAIKAAFDTYTNVALGLVGAAPSGVGVSFDPVSYTGSWDRSEDRTFTFNMTLTGLAAGTYDFGVGAFVDGGRVALESDHITVVGPVSEVPLPGALPLLLGAFGLQGALRRRRRNRA